MDSALLHRIAAAYGLPEARILPPQKGYRNAAYPLQLPDGRMYNLILYKSEPGVLTKINNANHISNFLAARRFPARHTMSSRIIHLQAGPRHKYGALYNYLPGHTIPWEAYTQAHLKLLGKTMSDMHQALQTQRLITPVAVTDEYQAITTRMERYFAQPQVIEALARKLRLIVPARRARHFHTLLGHCHGLPGQQPLHMDFVRGNILFEEKQKGVAITGILDFEKTTTGHPLFDIARTVAFLLVDCKYTPEEKVRKYFLHSGYHKRGAMPLHNFKVHTRTRASSLLEALVNLFLYYDLYKFLRHNPYEYLAQNEHFVRTRDLLVRRNIITMIE